MSHKSLKIYKKCSFIGKKIHWSINSNSLNLEIELDWVKYEEGGLILPPVELGRCKDWHFELSDDETTGTFISSWSIRRVKDKLGLIDSINDNIQQYALDS